MSKQDKATPPVTRLIGDAENHYIDKALDKAGAKLHPNFVAKAADSVVKARRRIQANTLSLSDHSALKPAQLAIRIGASVADDMQTYVIYWTQLLADVAFAAHMDLIAHERSVNFGELESSLDAMGYDHPAEPGDRAAFDKSMDARGNEREPYAGGDTEPLPDVNDILEAVNNIQTFVGVAFSKVNAESRAYWGLDGEVYFCKRGEDEDYAPVTDFDEYREIQNARWKAKQRQAVSKPEMEQTAELLEALAG